MFEQLDDPDGFDVDEQFFTVTSRRFAKRHRNRTATRVAGGAACLAVAAPVFLGAYQSHRNDGAPADQTPVVGDSSVDSEPSNGTTASDTFPPDTSPADAPALNLLIVGTDDPSCQGRNERADSIMVLRLDAAEGRAAVLSFPRDLWVGVPGEGKARINSVYRRGDPQLLIDTLGAEFGVPVDHFVQIDYCGFEKLVDAVGGVALPVPYPLRDENTGFFVPVPGCASLDGEAALAYVRSRHLQYMDANGVWQEDPSADLGRIARQQDLLRRLLDHASGAGALRPEMVGALYATLRDDLIVDIGLTIDKLIELAVAIRGMSPAGIHGYQIEATGTNIAGSSVLVWHKDSTSMQSILDIFRGIAPLGVAPKTVTETAPASKAPESAMVPDPQASC